MPGNTFPPIVDASEPEDIEEYHQEGGEHKFCFNETVECLKSINIVETNIK